MSDIESINKPPLYNRQISCSEEVPNFLNPCIELIGESLGYHSDHANCSPVGCSTRLSPPHSIYCYSLFRNQSVNDDCYFYGNCGLDPSNLVSSRLSCRFNL